MIVYCLLPIMYLLTRIWIKNLKAILSPAKSMTNFLRTCFLNTHCLFSDSFTEIVTKHMPFICDLEYSALNWTRTNISYFLYL